MFRYGMTQWVAGNEALRRSFARLRSCGYELIEFAAEPDTADAQQCRRLMAEYGIRCASLCGMFTEERDLSASPQEALAAVQYLKDSIDWAVSVGASVLILVPAPVGRTQPSGGRSISECWHNAVVNIGLAAEYAQEKGVCLAIEPINRYETFLVNTIEQACRMADEINSPAVGVMADAFHMNLEESNPVESLLRCGRRLKHVHIADSNRKAAGAGHTDFTALLRALRQMNYQGALVMEFMCRSSNPYDALTMDSLSDMMDQQAQISIDTIRSIERAVWNG